VERRRALLVVAEDEVGRFADVARGDVARDLLVPARVEKGQRRLCSVSIDASTTSASCSSRPSQTERDAPRCRVLLPSDVDLPALRCREGRLVVDLALRAVAAVEDAVRSCSGRSTGQLDARWTGLRERERGRRTLGRDGRREGEERKGRGEERKGRGEHADAEEEVRATARCAEGTSESGRRRAKERRANDGRERGSEVKERERRRAESASDDRAVVREAEERSARVRRASFPALDAKEEEASATLPTRTKLQRAACVRQREGDGPRKLRGGGRGGPCGDDEAVSSSPAQRTSRLAARARSAHSTTGDR